MVSAGRLAIPRARHRPARGRSLAQALERPDQTVQDARYFDAHRPRTSGSDVLRDHPRGAVGGREITAPALRTVTPTPASITSGGVRGSERHGSPTSWSPSLRRGARRSVHTRCTPQDSLAEHPRRQVDRLVSGGPSASYPDRPGPLGHPRSLASRAARTQREAVGRATCHFRQIAGSGA